jgi:Glycosyltransferase WbsX
MVTHPMESRQGEHPRFVALYLPQFHPTTYNDEWWGRGFTEWTNVVKARPRFRGHYQPHLPADLGFYDLRLAQAREAQANLAREYGIHGFCYYHYWFNGRRLLEQPLDEVIALGAPDFPFCICWANENWSRKWDGGAHQILVRQEYSLEDDLNHIRSLLPTLRDSRYIRIEGKPLLLVYRTEALPSPAKTADIWRSEAIRDGIGDLFLVSVESDFNLAPRAPETFGFDAALQFEPNRRHHYPTSLIGRVGGRIRRMLPRREVFSYPYLYRKWLQQPAAGYRRFDCVTPMWDNTPRRNKGEAVIYTGSSPEAYERWLREAVRRAHPDADGQQWVFLNAWNEWAEGCHLEPCQKWGHAYLNSTKRVFDEALRHQSSLP